MLKLKPLKYNNGFIHFPNMNQCVEDSLTIINMQHFLNCLQNANKNLKTILLILIIL